ncbi:MAG: hypothetical protein ACK59G_01335 [Cyanobacteriota bacterium]
MKIIPLNEISEQTGDGRAGQIRDLLHEQHWIDLDRISTVIKKGKRHQLIACVPRRKILYRQRNEPIPDVPPFRFSSTKDS